MSFNRHKKRDGRLVQAHCSAPGIAALLAVITFIVNNTAKMSLPDFIHHVEAWRGIIPVSGLHTPAHVLTSSGLQQCWRNSCLFWSVAWRLLQAHWCNG